MDTPRRIEPPDVARDDRRMELPLFPLNTVLCPGIALPLHVFEDRYRVLVRQCIDSGAPFGIVLIREGREVGAGAVSFTAIGTIAEIRDAGRDEEGRYDVLVVGTRRFAIQRVLDGSRPYLVAEVEILDETVGDEVAARRLAMKATRRFVTYLELLQPRSGETADEIDVRVEVETADDDEEGAESTEQRGGADTAARPADDSGGAADAKPADADAPAEAETDAPAEAEAEPVLRRRRVMIPDDPTILSHLLAGIIQVELPRRQALLETATTEARLRELLRLIDREIFLLTRRLRAFTPDPNVAGPRRS